ncbi:amino acid ABC transporter permease [Occultella aeris]|uniref:Putative glutamine ABC transporter permease protein GlnM n=1 Tax=Occultella aeris TaxID=2761496 RepID=A0A7M4DP25_9MICO|nr:amino acid ABC transporter permease [Occultella aeris]VZO39211.1 putative glutamine ABC transporter permease protein GlnM [Occultella aeris]
MSEFLAVLSNYDLVGAYWLNIQLTFFAGLASLVIGTILALMRISPIPSLQFAGTTYVNLIRNTPLTIIVVFAALVLWPVLGVEFSTDFATNFFWLAVAALSVYHASFMCEALRSGVNTVPAGQAEAARAIGLPFLPAARLIILPQAFRGAIAPLGNTLIALIKNSTVAAAISVPEISILMKEMMENEGNYVIPIFLTVAVGFVIIVVPIGLAVTYLSQRLAVSR